MFQHIFKFTRADKSDDIMMIKVSENVTVKSIGSLIFKLDVAQ